MIIILLWDWWAACSKVIAGNKTLATDEICFHVHKHQLEFTTDEVQAPILQTKNETWQLPRTCFIKVNYDVAFCRDTHEGVWGIIARSE
jgi:hypothetical protein